jgi:hypothetical protein
LPEGSETIAVDLPRACGGKDRAWTRTHQFTALALLLAIALVPLATVTYPPLVDYPNHLARMHLLFETTAADPVRQFYQPAWHPLPNLAMETVMPLLLRFTTLETGGRLFVALTLVLMASGVVALHHAVHGRWSPWPLVAVLVLYNRILLWGFLNYLFALGLTFWLLALWVRGGGADTRGRAVAFSVAAVVLMHAHLFAFGFFALCIVAYAWGRGRGAGRTPPVRHARWRAVLRAAAPLLPAVLLFLAVSPTREAVAWFEYGAPVRKLAALGSLFNNYDPALDAATFIGMAILLGMALVRGRLSLAPNLHVPAGLLLVAFLVMPGTVFASQGADTRFALGIALFLVAATDLRPGPLRWRATLAGLLLAIFCLRMLVIAAHWQKADAAYGEYTRAFAQLPAGTRLYTIDMQDQAWRPFPTPTAHIPCLAIIDRAAFVPTLFAHATQQPLRMTPGYAPLAARTPTAVHYRGEALPWAEVARDYTHLLLIHHGTAVPVPPGYTRVWQAEAFDLYRIDQERTAVARGAALTGGEGDASSAAVRALPACWRN